MEKYTASIKLSVEKLPSGNIIENDHYRDVCSEMNLASWIGRQVEAQIDGICKEMAEEDEDASCPIIDITIELTPRI